MNKKSVSTRIKNLRNMGQRRRKQIVLMVIAISLLFIGVPYVLHLISEWNDIIPDGPYKSLEEEDFATIPIDWKGSQSIAKVSLWEVGAGSDSGYEKLTVAWGGNVSNDHIGVITNHVSVPYYQRIDFHTKIKIDDMIANDTLEWKFKFNTSASIKTRIYVGILEGDMSDKTSGNNFSPRIITQTDFTAIHDKTFTLSILDMLENKAKYGNNNLTFSIAIEPGQTFETGDTFTFSILYKEEVNGEIKSMTVMNIGALIIGAILLIIAFVSTPWWNPTDSSNPGWFDQALGKIFIRLSSRGNKKK